MQNTTNGESIEEITPDSPGKYSHKQSKIHLKKKYFLYTDFIKNLTQVHKSIIRGLVRESIGEIDMKNETKEESKN